MRSARILGALIVATVVLATPAIGHAYDANDFDSDGVPNENDNCLIVANPDQELGDSGTDGAACSGENQRSTIEALRFGYTADQLEAIYDYLDAGPMPGQEILSRGWVRCQFGVECLGFDGNPAGNALINDPVVPILWRGQWWFTDDDGGHLLNRTLNDSQRNLRGEVAYDTSLIDGEEAIVVTYEPEYNPPPIDHIVLECRNVQTGILHCFAWGHMDLGIFGTHHLLLFNVFQDLTSPEL